MRSDGIPRQWDMGHWSPGALARLQMNNLAMKVIGLVLGNAIRRFSALYKVVSALTVELIKA